jgi:peptidoglycan/LPS O-acetylase OafA/YrhL
VAYSSGAGCDWLWFFAVFIVYRSPFLIGKIHFPNDRFFFGDALSPVGDLWQLLRFLAYFCAGGCFYLYRDKVVFKPALLIATTSILLFCQFTERGRDVSLILFLPYILFYLAFANIPFLDRFKTTPDVSYGLYLYGWPIQKLLLWYFPLLSPWLLFLFATVAAWGCGLLSWKLVEQPFLKLKPRETIASI